MDANARPDASRGPPATSATASDRVPSSKPSDGATKWQARRRRRRDRRRARLAEEALDHDPDDEDHWRETARRHAREAVRREVRRGMLAPWSDDGVGGLRIIIDLGMESPMNDAELKSLVTQVQLSYAAVLRRTVDEIIRRAQPRPSTDPEFTDATPSPSADASARRVSARGSRGGGGGAAVETADTAVRPRVLLSSLDGRAEVALRRDAGSAAWPVRASKEMFEVAARRAVSGEDPGAAPEGSDASEVSGVDPRASKSVRRGAAVEDRRDVAGRGVRAGGCAGPRCVSVVGGLCDYRRIANATLDRAEAAGVEARTSPIEETFGGQLHAVNILTVNQTVEALCRAGLNEEIGKTATQGSRWRERWRRSERKDAEG